MTHPALELDVRPILRAGGEPFSAIMAAVNGLEVGQPLRLLATFEPVPLYSALAKKGFDHSAQEIGSGDWEVLFTPSVSIDRSRAGAPIQPAGANLPVSAWPHPTRHLDNRDLEPPEPLVRTLAAVEEIRPGEVLCALLCREPVFLLPKLAERGHEWHGAFEPDGKTFKLLVRKGTQTEPAK